MQNKRKVIFLVIGVISLLTVVIGASYAYFSATVSGSGNDNGSSSIMTAELPSLIYNNGENFNGENVYPGYKNIHSFTVKPQPNSKGSAVYVLHLNANVPSEFGSDIKVTVYKTTDKTNNNLSRTEGILTPVTGLNGEYQYSKTDIITTKGSLEKVYERILITNSDLIIEEKQFDESLPETTYFLVYEYVETSANQDAAQGKSFTGKITVSLQRELTPKDIPTLIKSQKVINGEGVYEVNHDEAIIGTHMNETQTTNLKQIEYRYAGKNPNNYIQFNNELWRIIGLVNTPEGSRVKLIRNESIGNYSWDSSLSSINSGYGVNEWSQADIMKLLNPGYESETIGGSLYWNKTSGNCYNGTNNTSVECDFTSKGLKSEAKNMIDTVTWNIGTNDINDYMNLNTNHFYGFERSNNNSKLCFAGNYCNDTVNRTTTWSGNVGLISPSDYGYATLGGNTTNRDICLNHELYGWSNNSFDDCKNSNWLFLPSISQWVMNSRASVQNNSYALSLLSDGSITRAGASDIYNIRPAVYLDMNQKIISGDGTESNPYVLK